MELLTRKNGIWITVIGIAIFLLNFLTYTLWEIDIDILGAMIFVLGIVLVIACGKSMKNSSELLSRRNGVWLCIISEATLIITAYLPFINGDFGGLASSVIFMLGVILITMRWNH
jgi:hypothetical protein